MKKTVKQLLAVMFALWLSASLVMADESGEDRSFLSDLFGNLNLESLMGGEEEASSGGGLGDLLTLIGLGSYDMKDCEINPVKDQAWTGKAVTPSLTIKHNGTRLKKNTDYTVSYSNNIKVGTATCTVTGQGIYQGTRKVTFRIVKNSSGSSSAGKKTSGKKTSQTSGSSSKTSAKTGKFSVKVSSGSYTYTGNARTPSVKVTYRGKSVTSKNYSVSYRNNTNVGKAAVQVRGKGEYKGVEGETSFKITLKKTTVKTASSPEAGVIKAGWTADSQAEGYQLQVSMDPSFETGVKRIKISSGKTQTETITGLTAGRKYYVRIRSFKKVEKSNWYSEWSAGKQVSVK